MIVGLAGDGILTQYISIVHMNVLEVIRFGLSIMMGEIAPFICIVINQK